MSFRKSADHYKTLGLSEGASQEEIKRAYRKLAMKWHPDRNPGNSAAEEEFKKVKEAYEYLTEFSDRSSSYSNTRSSNSGNYNESEEFKSWMEDILYKFNEQRTKEEYSYKQRTPTQVITISLSDAYTGKNVNIGKIVVPVPAGIESGQFIQVNDQLFKIVVSPDKKFKRAGKDLLIDLEISAIEAIIGIEVLLEHLDRAKLQFSVPAGIQQGRIIKLAKKGMPDIAGSQNRGDLLVRMNIIIPSNLGESELALIKQVTHRANITL